MKHSEIWRLPEGHLWCLKGLCNGWNTRIRPINVFGCCQGDDSIMMLFAEEKPGILWWLMANHRNLYDSMFFFYGFFHPDGFHRSSTILHYHFCPDSIGVFYSSGVQLVEHDGITMNIFIENAYSGWWFGTFFIFPLGIIIQTDEFIFFTGVRTTNQFHRLSIDYP